MSQIADRVAAGDSSVLLETVGTLLMMTDSVVHIEREDLLALLSLAVPKSYEEPA